MHVDYNSMANFQLKYNELEEKLCKIIIRLNEYQQVIKHEGEEKAVLKNELETALRERDEWKNKYQNLNITQTLLKKEDKKEIKKEINELVREIDYCIGYINGKE